MAKLEIPHELREALNKHNIKLDMLGQKLEIGDTVLTKSYGSPAHDTIASIKRINPVNIVLDVPITGYDWNKINDWERNNPGKNWYQAPEYPDHFRYINEVKEMSRKPYDLIKFNEQTAIAKREFDKIAEEYPEYFL